MDKLLEKMTGIQQLWELLRTLKPHTSEYQDVTKRIRVLSEDYSALLDSSKNLRAPK